ncbi:MAG: S8 family peptidase [Umezawaea sp.]
MSRRARRVGQAALAITVTLSTVVGPAVASASTRPEGVPLQRAGGTVTLVTGDQVTLTDGGQARIRRAPGREEIPFQQHVDDQGHVIVLPLDAVEPVRAGQVDERLFDISFLVDNGYDDRARGDLPLILSYTDGMPRTLLAATSGVRELPSIGGTALRADKKGISAVWAGLRVGESEPGVLSAGVRKVALDGPMRADLDHSVPQIGAPEAWQAGYTGRGTSVAVLDTGIDATHPDLADAVTEAKDFTGSPSGTDDKVGHGTHVASIITGNGARSAGKYQGVAPDTRLLVAKVLDDTGNGTESGVIAGMEWAAAQGAKVISMSLGSPPSGGKDPTRDAVSESVNRLTAQSGALFVVSAGNSGPTSGSIGSPGVADAALTVGAVDRADALAGFSSRGPRGGDGAIKPDITAPGVDIVAARAANGRIGTPADDGYVALSGTSMAAPHVSGAAAILAGRYPDWTPAQLKSALMGSARPGEQLSVYQQGAGRVDIAKAVSQPVRAEPASVSMGTARWPHDDDQPIATTMTYQNSGATPVTLDLATDVRDATGNPAPAGMFTAEPHRLTVPAGGQATATLTADTRVDGPDGVYGGVLVATGDGNTVRTPTGVTREAERYDVTLNILDWQGNPTTRGIYSLADVDRAAVYAPAGPAGSSVIRVPPGRFFLNATVSGRDGQNNLIVALFAEPEITVAGNVEMTLDARTAKPVGMTTDRPNAKSGQPTLSLSRTTSGGVMRSNLYLSSLDRVSVRPSTTSAPGFTFTVESLFAEPDGQGGFAGSPYLYHLRWGEQGRVPGALVRHFADTDLAGVRSEHASSGTGQLGKRELMVQAPLPFTLQEYYSPDTPWVSFLDQPTGYPGPGALWTVQSTPRTFRHGDSLVERWNAGVIGPSFPQYVDSPAEWAGRTGDVAHVNLWTYGDQSNDHYGMSGTDTAGTTLYQGDRKIAENPWSGYNEFTLPPEEATYRLHNESTRSGFSDLSTRISADWTFRSSRVEGAGTQPIPLMAVRFAPRLDDHNRAPAGTVFPVPVRVQHTDPHGEVATLTVRVSYNDGTTWQVVPLVRDRGQWLALLRHPANGAFVSFKATAGDRKGNTVSQTIIRGYRLA